MNFLSNNEIRDKLLQELPEFDNSYKSKYSIEKLYSTINEIRYRHASVLIPLTVYNDNIHIILTLRSINLPTHAGQISFPGGKVDEYDMNPMRTAYREAAEEIGLNEDLISLQGYLDIYRTGTKYIILPVVGFVSEDYEPKLNKGEVEDLIYLPLDFIADKSNLQYREQEINGEKRFFYVYEYNDHFIWGATAHMLKSLSERLFEND
ncbi:MAG: CoA pyrophosphatase [Hyphomicrobiales bacterium]|nr:CoA pyrophosphatase [Hyphomicrobiales bacterium]|tara:strand:- start:149 stop:769 length:621 start_codon:yes stop_codon:yes gene_type:complete